MSEPPTFKTARLTLRPFTGDDVDALAPVFGDRDAMWDVLSIPGTPDDPRDVAAQRIAHSMAGWRARDAGFWAIVTRERDLGTPGRIAGYCGFVDPAHSELDESERNALEVGWGIHPALQRRGLAAEAMAPVLDYAFNRRGCARLFAITHPENRASRALSERLGFRFERSVRAYGAPQVRYVLERGDYAGNAPVT